MKLRDCDACLVYGTDNKPLARARVEVGKDGQIRLYFSTYRLKSIRYQTYVDFYDTQQGLIRCYCELVIRKNAQANRVNEPWLADCDILDVDSIFQRQKDLRVRVHIVTDFTLESGEHFIGTIRNISAGGIFLVTSQAVKTGEIFRFSHRFDKELCQIRARIIRARGAAAGGFGYGCQFIDLSSELEATIRKFVFAKQMEKQRNPGKDRL